MYIGNVVEKLIQKLKLFGNQEKSLNNKSFKI